MKTLLSLLTLVSLSLSCSAADEDEPTQKKLSQQIQGKWILSGKPDKILPAPKGGGQTKTIKGNKWEVLHKHPKTGEVIIRHGGTYTLKGNLYTESIEYADDSTKFLVGQKFKFKVSVNKDGILLQHGQGNPWTEAWRPVK